MEIKKEKAETVMRRIEDKGVAIEELRRQAEVAGGDREFHYSRIRIVKSYISI